MNRRDLVKAIAAHTDVDAKTVDAVLKGFTDVTTHVVAKGEPVAITGFAKFAKVERAARMGRNPATGEARSEEHTSELQSLMRISYAVFCLKKKTATTSCATLHD